MSRPVAESPGAGRRCAVLGSPIEHSLSPALHQAAYRHLGLDSWSYERFEMVETGLADFVNGRDACWRGLSLTMPLKFAALELGEVDESAALVGAANTLIFDGDTRRVYNTDIGGLVSALRRVSDTEVATVLIMGAGATARSALASSARLGARQVMVMARTLSKAEDLRPLATVLGVELEVITWGSPIPVVDLVISTVTAGAADSCAEALAQAAPVVFDVIYDPWPTVLATAARGAGAQVVNGLDLLVGQAVLQIELMTGRSVEAEILLSAGRTALSRRNHA